MAHEVFQCKKPIPVLDIGLVYQLFAGLAYCLDNFRVICPVCLRWSVHFTPWARCHICGALLFEDGGVRGALWPQPGWIAYTSGDPCCFHPASCLRGPKSAHFRIHHHQTWHAWVGLPQGIQGWAAARYTCYRRVAHLGSCFCDHIHLCWHGKVAFLICFLHFNSI